MLSSKDLFKRRQMRTRAQIRRKANGRPRLSVFRSSKHIYAQVIDDIQGHTLVAASSLEKDLKGRIKTGDRKSVVSGKSVTVRVDLGGRSIIKKKKKTTDQK